MTIALVLLALAAFAGLVVVGFGAADRFALAQAQTHATEYLSAPLGKAARVQVHGSPFLTQAVRGRYGDVEVSASDLQIGTITGTTLHAHLVNVELPLRDLLGRRARELPVEHVHGHVVIPYAELARISQLPGLRFRYRDGRLLAVASIPIPGISQLARVSGDAVAAVDDTGGVWLRVRNLSVAGLAVPSLVLTQLLPALAFPIPLPELPYGLRLEQLTPTEDGLRVAGSARAVVFRAAG
ncbi:MAG TPA: DUF2993 domain-containing protein [Jatrophihabitantaceae bacterium]|jgi:hypothetical protein